MDKNKTKFFVRLQMVGPAILKSMYTHVGFHKLGTHFDHAVNLEHLAWEYYINWIYIRLTGEELAKIDLSKPGSLYIAKIDLVLPYWSIDRVEISTSSPKIHPAERHWAIWSEFPGWGNCDYLKQEAA